MLNQQQCLPKYWALPMINNFSRHTLNPQSTEYIFVADKFYQSWANFKNQNPVPAPLPPPVMGIPPPPPLPPPPPSVPVPPTNNLPHYLLPTALLSRMPTMYPSTNNNNNGSTGNQPLPPPPPPNHTFGPIPLSMPLATNTMVQTGPIPSIPLPPAPPPPPPSQYYPQPTYRPTISYTRSRAPPQFPPNNVAVRTRQPRNTNPITNMPQIIQIERVQNQRWYKQYSAHECEFRQKLGKQTEQWLFHGDY